MTSKPTTQAPIVQGWCPGALRPMLSGDGWVVRVRAHGGRLTPQQAAGVAELSAQYGNGLLDLSARANLQIRGVSETAHPDLISGLRALGLIDTDIATETGRNILTTPFYAGNLLPDMVAQLETALAAARLPLPGKFGYALDIGPKPVLRDASADIRVEQADGALIVRADGMTTGAAVTSDSFAGTVIALAEWFLAQGGVTNGRGRMAALIAKGTPTPKGFDAVPMSAETAPVAAPGLTDHGALIGLEFGQIAAETLDQLAALGPLRLTPWRMILIEGLATLPALPGLISDPSDPRRRVTACTGAPGCLQALRPTRDLAHVLAPLIPAGQMLHVSGCAKGCAHPGPAPLTLTATAQGFDLIRNGTAADAPALTGLAPDTLTQDFPGMI